MPHSDDINLKLPKTAIRPKILLVDDLKANLIALEALLKSDVIEIFKANLGIEALEVMIQNEFVVVLIDV